MREPSRNAAVTNSGLFAICPFSRASSRRLPVGSSVFSPESLSAIDRYRSAPVAGAGATWAARAKESMVSL